MHEFWLAQYQPHKFLTSLRFCIESCVGQLRKPPPRIFVPVHYFCFCPWLKFLDVCLIVPCTLDDAEFVTAFILLTAIAYSQLHVSTNPLCRCSRINLTVITLTDSFLVPRLLATCRRTCVPIASRCCGRNAWRIVLVFFFFLYVHRFVTFDWINLQDDWINFRIVLSVSILYLPLLIQWLIMVGYATVSSEMRYSDYLFTFRWASLLIHLKMTIFGHFSLFSRSSETIYSPHIMFVIFLTSRSV